MSYSSSLSEALALEPEVSDSLDTMLGLSTETGRETAVTPSSSSGTQALTDPTLASSESSRPPTPPLEGRGRPQPAPWPGPQPPQDGGPRAPHLALPLAANAAIAAAWAWAWGGRSSPASNSRTPGKAASKSRENPWVAPDFSRDPDVCRQWDMQQEHICLHSYAPSDRSSGSAGSLRRAEVPGLPGAAQRLPPVSSQQPCPMDQWVRESESGRQEQLSPAAAAEEQPPE